MSSRSRSIARILALATVLHGCGGDSTGPTTNADPCANGPSGSSNGAFSAAGVFTVSPIALSAISFVTPLGNLNPPNHVYPTDHIFIIPTSAAAGANSVSAPAAGTVFDKFQPGGTDWKVTIKVDQSFFYYYYDHITPATGVSIGSTVSAGQIIGTNSGNASAIDFGVYNFNNAPLAGILNTCALVGEAHVDAPLKYYSGALQTSLYGKVSVSGGATKDGKIDYDESGKLVGNWVATGHRPTEQMTYGLSFVYNVANHSPRVSAGSGFGGGGGGGGSFGVQSGAPDFTTVTLASGQVNFRLYPTIGGDSSTPGAEYGVLAVQMLSATQIKVEIFPGNLTGTAVFDANALIYDR